MKQKNVLTEGKINRVILRFAVPFLLANFLQAFYGAVDLFVVGRFADSAAVSAVTVGSQVMQTITNLVLGITTGATVLLGRRIGEEDDKGAAHAVGTVVVLFVAIAVVLTPLMLLSTKGIVSLMSTPAEAAASAGNYIFICACGIPFIIGYNGVSGIFRGIGDSKTPLYFIGVACLVNIAGDFILVGYLGYGAPGAAIATTLAQAVSFLAFLWYMRVKNCLPFPVHKEDIRLHKASLVRIVKVGLPIALQDVLVNVSFLAITMIFNSIGLIASAAVGVVEKVIIFAILPSSAMASAVATMTAQNVGAGKEERAYGSLKWGIGYAFAFGSVACLLCQFFPESITGIFSNDRQVVVAAAQYLRSYSLDCLVVSVVFNMNSFFSGYGRSVIAFLHSMAATFLVRIPMTWLLSRQISDSLYILGFASPTASLLSLLVCLAVLVHMSKKIKRNNIQESMAAGCVRE